MIAHRLLALFISLLFSSCGAVKGLPKDLSAAKKGIEVAKTIKEGIEDLTAEMTPENEYYVGRAVATNLLAKAEYKYLDEEAMGKGELAGMSLYLNQIAQVIVASAMDSSRDDDRPAPLAGWHVVVLEEEGINATAAPGGFIFVTTGAVKLAESEDELAALIAHEVAHVVRGHALGTIKKSRTAGIGKDLLTKTGALSGEEVAQLTTLLEGAIDDMIDGLLVKGYSKDTEFEADALGLAFTEAAGYDPHAMANYLGRMAKEQDTGEGGFYATHPSAANRIAKLKVEGKPKIARARNKRFRKAMRKAF